MYQAGTLSGNPLAVAAGLAALQVLADDPPYARLEALAVRLAGGLAAAAGEAGVPVTINREGSLLSVFFTADPVSDFESASRQDTAGFATFFNAMLRRGIWLPPSAFEGWFFGAAHTEQDVERTLEAAGEAFRGSAG